MVVILILAMPDVEHVVVGSGFETLAGWLVKAYTSDESYEIATEITKEKADEILRDLLEKLGDE